MGKPKLVIFASGTAKGGGSGFENLARSANLNAEIVTVVSNHEHGGIRERAVRLGIPFVYFAGPYDAEHYQAIVTQTGAEWVVLSGWLKKVSGLDPRKTVNIHPTLFSQGDRFRGAGMYGPHIHEAIADALAKGEVSESGFTMHFVTEEYDKGPAFFEFRVPLRPGMSAHDIEEAVKKAEHEWQPKITNMVIHGDIQWDGKDLESLIVPKELSA